MAISFIQQAQALTNAGSSSQAATWSGNTTSGNLIIVFIGTVTLATRVSSITDSQGNTYSFVASLTTGISAAYWEVWIAKNITGGTTPTVTANLVGSTFRPMMQISEYSGLDTTQPIDQILVKNFPTSTATYGFELSENKAANELIFVASLVNQGGGTFSAGAGYSNLQNQTNISTGNQATESKIVSSKASHTGTITCSSSGTNGNILVLTLADITLPPPTYPTTNNNYQSIKVGDGMSTGERIR